MRILYLNYGPQSGVTASVLRHLRAAEHDVDVFDPVAGLLYKRPLGRRQVPNLAPGALLASAAAALRFGRRWKDLHAHTCWAFDRLTERCDREIARVRPEAVLQAGVLFAPGTPGRWRAFLYCDHTRALNEDYPRARGLAPPIPFDPRWRRRETEVYRRAEGIFTMSEHAARSLTFTYGVSPERVHVVGAGPNVAPGPDGSPARPLAPDPTRPTLLFVGSDFVAKGGRDLLAAFEAVRARHPGARLELAGGGQPRRAPPGVALLGLLSPGELARRYAGATAFVLPTLREAFGLAFLEAMSFGLPCVGTRIEAIPEIVADGETGLLVPPRDPEALAQALLLLLGDPARARAMGEAGRARAAARFGWARAVARMLEVMEGGETHGYSRSPGAKPGEGVG